MSDEKIPRSVQILREKNVGPFPSSVLGTCIGHLIGCGLHDDEVLTVVSDLLKMRSVINDPACLAYIEKMKNSIRRELSEEGSHG